jgi:Flp pilus assembly protein TadB
MAEETSVTKVRVGLALITLVVVVALVMIAVIDSPAGKAVMFAIAVTAVVRAYLLFRSLRREQRAAD